MSRKEKQKIVNLPEKKENKSKIAQPDAKSYPVKFTYSKIFFIYIAKFDFV